MKKCPRCRTPLTKTHSKNIVCGVCAFTVINLQVVADNQDIPQRINYTKKIVTKQEIHKPQAEEDITTTKIVIDMVGSYQGQLREAVKRLAVKYNTSQEFEKTVREIWMSYLEKMKANNLRISGAFHKYISKKVYDKKKVLNVQKKQKQQQNQQPQKKEKRKRGRPKKSIIPKQAVDVTEDNSEDQKPTFKDKFTEIKKNSFEKTMQELREEALSLIYHWQLAQNDKILYFCEKYCQIVVSIRSKTTSHFILNDIKHNKVKISMAEIKKVGTLRGHNMKTKQQFMLIILLQDLLKLWANQNLQNYKQDFDELLISYRKSETFQRNPVIDKILDELLKAMKLGHYEVEEKQIPVPGLSFMLIYAFLYLSSLKLKLTLTIDDIIRESGKLSLKLNEQTIENNEMATPSKVRQICQKICSFLNMPQIIPPLNLQGWIKKYCEAFDLKDHEGKICEIGNVVIPLRIEMKSQRTEKKERYLFLEQDILSKSLILVYLKMVFNFDRFPLLITLPIEQIQSTLTSPKEIKKLQKLKKVIEEKKITQINICRMNKALKKWAENKNHKKNVFVFHDYSSLNNVPTKELKKIFNSQIHRDDRIQLPKKHIKNQINQPIFFSKNNFQEPKIRQMSELVMEQLEVVDYEEFSFDYPAENYQILYEYMGNIAHIQRQGFVHISENMVGGQCKMKEFYEELEKLQRILIPFQV